MADDEYQESYPSPTLNVTDTKQLEGYKFFDTFLNKKFFAAVGELIECIERNYKCIVESIKTKFVLGANREPHLVAIYELYLKPALKLYQMR